MAPDRGSKGTGIMWTGIVSLLIGIVGAERLPGQERAVVEGLSADSANVEVAVATFARSTLLKEEIAQFFPDVSGPGMESATLRSEGRVAAIQRALGGPARARVCRTSRTVKCEQAADVGFLYRRIVLTGDSATVHVLLTRAGESATWRFVLDRERGKWKVREAKLVSFS